MYNIYAQCFPSLTCAVHVDVQHLKRLGNGVKLSLVENTHSTQEQVFCLVIVKAYIFTSSWLQKLNGKHARAHILRSHLSFSGKVDHAKTSSRLIRLLVIFNGSPGYCLNASVEFTTNHRTEDMLGSPCVLGHLLSLSVLLKNAHEQQTASS